MSRNHTTASAISRAIGIHGDRYDYSLFEYHGDKNPSIIICKEHGPFEQRAGNHLQGQGCPDCGLLDRSEKRRLGKKRFLEQCLKIHGEAYDYSQFVYHNNKTSGVIICPIHGEFSKTPIAHLNKKRGCPFCTNGYYERKSSNTFIRDANLIHEGRYNYDRTIYKGAFVKTNIVCHKHGQFEQAPKEHLRGRGCPKCSTTTSTPQLEIAGYFKMNGYEVSLNDRNAIAPLELDVFIPELKLAIEYCGLYWHTENILGKEYHYEKYNRCKEQNIVLITIFEDEWLEKKDCVLRILQNRTGNNKTITGARNLDVTKISARDSHIFLETFHIAGKSRGSVHLGAYHKNELIGVMTFGKPTRQSTHEWELLRFATSGLYPGLASKMFRTFVKDYNPNTVVTFADCRWFSGKVFERMGFKFQKQIPIDYSYVKNKRRYHKSFMRKERVQNRECIPTEGKTEKMLSKELGYSRIWDCGKNRYEWFNHE